MALDCSHRQSAFVDLKVLSSTGPRSANRRQTRSGAKRPVLLQTHPGILAVKPESTTGARRVGFKDNRDRSSLTACPNASRPIRPSTECASSSQCQISKGHDPSGTKAFQPAPSMTTPRLSPLAPPQGSETDQNRIGKDRRLNAKSASARSTIDPTLCVFGGARRDRTDDLMLAKHALSQLSYGPVRGRMMRRQTTDKRPSVVCPPSSDNGGPGRT